MARTRTQLVIVMPVGPGSNDKVLDTLASIDHYAVLDYHLVLVDDHTTDGTFETLSANAQPNWHILRMPRPNGYRSLTITLQEGFRYVLEHFDTDMVCKIDVDALATGPGFDCDALQYLSENPWVGIFGRFLQNADGSAKMYQSHIKRMRRVLSPWLRYTGMAPCYAPLARRAMLNSWGIGQNIFGGAYFMRTQMLREAAEMGALKYRARGWQYIEEDLYFTFVAYAVGYGAGHFAAPSGPICMAWQGLPMHPSEIHAHGYKLIHSVDKGPYTEPDPETGQTPREYFAQIRAGQPPARETEQAQPIVIKPGEPGAPPSTLDLVHAVRRRLRSKIA